MRLTDEPRVRGEDDTFLAVAVLLGVDLGIFEFGEGEYRYVTGSYVFEVTHGVVLQVVGDTQPRYREGIPYRS